MPCRVRSVAASLLRCEPSARSWSAVHASRLFTTVIKLGPLSLRFSVSPVVQEVAPQAVCGERAGFSDRGLAGSLAITFGQQRAYRRQLEKLERWPVSRATPKDLREKLVGSPSAYVVHKVPFSAVHDAFNALIQPSRPRRRGRPGRSGIAIAVVEVPAGTAPLADPLTCGTILPCDQ